jgi:hypothetical protein
MKPIDLEKLNRAHIRSRLRDLSNARRAAARKAGDRA